VAETGSVSGAAKALSLSQPAITRALQQLELSVGASLLTRTSHGIELTECGQAMLQHARNIVREAVDAQAHVKQLAGDLSGRLSIASSAAPFDLVVPRAIEMMRLHFPDIYVEMLEAVYPVVMDKFREKGLDFAIGPLPAEGLGDGFRCDPLFSMELVVAIKRGHSRSKAQSLRQLIDLPWMITGPHSGPGAVLAQAFINAGCRLPRCVMHCESVGGAIQIIEHSGLVSFVPRQLAEVAQAAGLVSIVNVQESLPKLEIYSFLPSHKILTPAGQALYSAVQTVSRSLKYGSA
jgi:DNA-binding transcriptional LysR family regulator